MGVIEDTGMSDRDKMEMMIEVSGIHSVNKLTCGDDDFKDTFTIIFLQSGGH